ncbi:MAG: DUF4168 domain-containing protein [Salegentibacter sp.]
MFKTGKIAGMLFAIALLGAAPAFAQSQPAPQQQQEKIDVSDAELAKFAKAYQGMRMVNQQAQQKMLQTVQESGFDVKRFNEIHQAKMTGKEDVELSAEEKENYKNVLGKIQEMQPEFQKKMEDVITSAGLTMDRYEQLAMALQNDPQLQQRLKDILSS